MKEPLPIFAGFMVSMVLAYFVGWLSGEDAGLAQLKEPRTIQCDQRCRCPKRPIINILPEQHQRDGYPGEEFYRQRYLTEKRTKE